MIDIELEFSEKEKSLKELGEVLKNEDSPWNILADSEFWDAFYKLRDIARNNLNADESVYKFLTSLVLIDDLGVMARGLFLSNISLLVISILNVSYCEFFRSNFPVLQKEWSYYKKVGYCKIVKICNINDRNILASIESDPNDKIRKMC